MTSGRTGELSELENVTPLSRGRAILIRLNNLEQVSLETPGFSQGEAGVILSPHVREKETLFRVKSSNWQKPWLFSPKQFPPGSPKK